MPFRVAASYFLSPGARLRAGSHAADLARAQPLPASDSLFGALAWALQLTKGAAAVEQWMARFAGGDPPFLLSSAFPATRALLTLVPRPIRRGHPPEELPDRKYLDDAVYIDAELLPWLAGGPGTLPLKHEGALIAEHKARELGWTAPAPAALASPPAWRTDERPRVTVDRITSRSEVYRSAATAFTGSAGLVIHVLSESESELQALDELLAVLSETGIGGERSSGLGHFAWERLPPALPLSSEPAAGPLLSLLSPKPREVEMGVLNAPQGRGYRLVERSGWISSPSWSSHRSRSVVMLAEGSYISPHIASPAGNMADVTPAVPLEGRHPVYRYGFGLFLDEARV